MALQGSPLLLLLLAAALVVLGVRDREGEDTPYKRFLRQHVRANSNGGSNDAYCDKEMRRMLDWDWKMDRNRPKVCKERNTFIHGNSDRITEVCTTEKGKDYRTKTGKLMRESTDSFQVTNCRHLGGAPLDEKHRGDCKYRASTSSRTIVIACEDGLPVHLEESLI